jgi:hypothetical protein
MVNVSSANAISDAFALREEPESAEEQGSFIFVTHGKARQSLNHFTIFFDQASVGCGRVTIDC